MWKGGIISLLEKSHLTIRSRIITISTSIRIRGYGLYPALLRTDDLYPKISSREINSLRNHEYIELNRRTGFCNGQFKWQWWMLIFVKFHIRSVYPSGECLCIPGVKPEGTIFHEFFLRIEHAHILVALFLDLSGGNAAYRLGDIRLICWYWGRFTQHACAISVTHHGVALCTVRRNHH